MNKKIITLIVLCLLYSCGRRSGRKATTSNRENTTKINISDGKKMVPSQRLPVNYTQRQLMSATEIYDKFNSAVFIIFTTSGDTRAQGSGFFISNTGLAVSNYHVFQGSVKGLETIKLINNRTFKISRIIACNETLDYILFQVDIGIKKVNYIPISKETSKVGEKAYAIGSPLGLENTFSSGEISQIRDQYRLQINVPIDHGSSGGALINTYGEAIGITTSGITKSNANLNFAMSIKVLDKHLSY